MHKYVLLSFLLTVLAANIDATVAPFSCLYTVPGTGTGEVLSAPNCVTACYRVTATGGIPTGANNINNNNAANSINGVINTVVSTQGGNLASGATQLTNVIGVGIQSKIGVQPHGSAGPGTTELGVKSLGNIGIITLPQGTTGNGLSDFVTNDKGCLPILALPPTPQVSTVRTGTAQDSNQIPYTIGRTCGTVDQTTGSCTNPVTCNFGAGTAGCLSGLAGSSLTSTLGQNSASEISGTTGIGSTGTTHVKQQQPTVAGTGGVPLQLAYNPIIGTGLSGTNAGQAISVPTGGANLLWPNLVANAQVNQAALDLAAVTTLFCVTSGVCCTSNGCNTTPVTPVRSSSIILNNNIIVILMSIICSIFF